MDLCDETVPSEPIEGLMVRLSADSENNFSFSRAFQERIFSSLTRKGWILASTPSPSTTGFRNPP